jgi:hypothetical protein
MVFKTIFIEGAVFLKERKIFLFLRNGTFESLLAVLSGFESLHAKERPDKIIEIIDSGLWDQTDYAHVREMALQEFFQDFTAFIVPDSPHFDSEPFLPFLQKANPGIFFIWDLISEITFSNRPDLKGVLKKYYYTLFGPETIDSVLGFIANDQNASKAAANLYMHRNTLNYRLDHFIKVSEIDVRSFKGAAAMYLLFRK